MYELEVKLYQ